MGKSSDKSENVSERLPRTEIEAAALRSAIADLLSSVPTSWSEFELDGLSKLQESAMFLLTAAGMIERRGWVRTRIANHPTYFEWRFQATGERGFIQASDQVMVTEYQVWGDAWNQWTQSEFGHCSPFQVQELKPQEWRLTDQGELAQKELLRARSDVERLTVLDFILKEGLYGPGYWARRDLIGPPASADEARIIAAEMAAGQSVSELSRPPVIGNGRLLEIRRVDQTTVPQAVDVKNWDEGATVIAKAISKELGRSFEAMDHANPVTTGEEPLSDLSVPNEKIIVPVAFRGGEVVFEPNRVLLCGVDICSGSRSQTRRRILELLAERTKEGTFIAYSGEALAEAVGNDGTEKRVAGAIRDLRDDIHDALLAANVLCDRSDVILSGGPGYRFADCISVQDASSNSITDITDIDQTEDVCNVRNDDVRNVRDVVDSGGEEAAKRRIWIIQQLKDGVELKAPMVAARFQRSTKTAQRDLDALREDGIVEFVGDPRTGFYRLRASALGP